MVTAIAHVHVLNAKIKHLREMLIQANEAFDECTGDYAKELVKDEPWRTKIWVNSD